MLVGWLVGWLVSHLRLPRPTGCMRRSWWVGVRVVARDPSFLLGFILSMLVVAPY